MPPRRQPGSFRFLASLLAASLLAACGSRQTPAVTPATLGRDAAAISLRRTVTRILGLPALEPATWGVAIKSLSTGESLYSLNARKLLLPGSNMKVVTLAVAGARLGW